MAAKHYADAVEAGCRMVAMAFFVLCGAGLAGAAYGIWSAFR